MGDRVLMQCYSEETGEFGPVVYCHSSGHDSPKIVAAFRERMKTRRGDVAYASARLVQEACGGNGGNLSFGIWNATALLTKEDSHGDAGVVLIDVDNFKCQCFGGYLKVSGDGLPYF